MTLSEYAIAASYGSACFWGACDSLRESVGLPVDGLQIDALAVHLVERRHLAQPLDLLDHARRDVVDLFFGVEATDAEADRGVRELFAHPHRAQHVARLEARAGAGAPARDRDVLDRHHHRLALHERERDVEVAWVAPRVVHP